MDSIKEEGVTIRYLYSIDRYYLEIECDDGTLSRTRNFKSLSLLRIYYPVALYANCVPY